MQPLGLTMGDPAGIGGELSLRAWRELRNSGPNFVALDDPERLTALAGQLGLSVRVQPVADPAAGKQVFPDALPVLPVRLPVRPLAGQPNDENAKSVVASIEMATKLAVAGLLSGIVTNPINKAALYQAGFAYPGHTEFLASLTGATGRQVMMLVSPMLRVLPVLVHLSLLESIRALTKDLLVTSSRTVDAALRRDFGIFQPRLAIAGLNPHAGEQGALGREEIAEIQPAIATLLSEGVHASGPWPPDTMFSASARARYDVAVCMYHDQALIPLKTLDMQHGVNVTLGLPIVRTSPDHGTAFDIAGKGVADPTSLIAAIRLAAKLAERRGKSSGPG